MSGAVIVDVNTKSCTFLTLTTYNGDKGTVIPANCSIRKDEPFLDSDRAFIACESWRLSVAPNKHGIIYAEIPWTYYITCDQAVTQQQRTDDEKNDAEMILMTRDDHPIQFVDVMQDKKIIPNKQQLTIKCGLASIARTLDINLLSNRLLKFMNHQMLTKGSVVQLTNPAIGNADPQKYLYTFLDNPLDKLTGPGYGNQGLLKIPGFYVYNTGSPTFANFLPSQFETQVQYIRFRIKKSQVPNMTKADLKRYFSRQLWLFREVNANAVIARASFQIFGPMFCRTNDDTQTIVSNGHRSPIQQIYCKNGGTFAQGTHVFQLYSDADGLHEKRSTITLISEFVFSEGDYWWIHLCGMPTPAGASATAAFPRPYFSNPPNSDYMYYAYDIGADPDDLTSSLRLTDYLFSTCEVTVTNLAKDPVPAPFNDLPNAETTTKPYLVHKLQERIRVTRRATENTPILTFSPNDFMQYFNCGFGDEQEQPYVLCTSPNGGWRIVVLSDNVSSLSISKQMVDDMGLNNFMTIEGIENKSGLLSETFPVVVEIEPDTTTQFWSWSWKEDFSNISTAQSLLQTRNYQEFMKITREGVDVAPLTNTDDAPEYLRTVDETTERKYYELVSMIQEDVVQTDISTVRHPGQLKIDADGVEFYEFIGIKKGSYIGNDSTVSIGSFSKYESIRIIVPSGLSFEPQIAQNSDARVLSELRLPFQNSAEVQQGFMKNEPLVMSTESAFLGDLTWSNPPSGLQYLPITTQGGIYDLEVAVELISRDPDIAPFRVQLGYNQIFQIKLRFLNRN